MLPDHTEHPCQVIAIDVEGATIRTQSPPEPDTAIVAYLDEIGRVEAVVETADEEGCTLRFKLSTARRERFKSKLDWLDNDDELGRDRRRHTRYEPRESKSQVTLQDGRVYPCEVLDISLSGAAVAIDVMPAIGTRLSLGKMHGRVVRLLDNGIAIEFGNQLDQTTLAEHIR